MPCRLHSRHYGNRNPLITGQKSTATILAAYDDGVIDKPTAMKELKQGSKETGLFTNITDEQIDDAENELPAPGESPPIPGQPDPTGTVSPQDPKRLPGEPKIPKAEVAAGPESKPDPDDAPKIPRKATKGILGKLKKYAGN